MILYDVHITVSVGRGLHSASTLQERSRQEAGKNFWLMFCDDGDVVNFPMLRPILPQDIANNRECKNRHAPPR